MGDTTQTHSGQKQQLAHQTRKMSDNQALDPLIMSMNALQVQEAPPSEQYMILLVGLPGSGKSTFARKLESAMPNKFLRINQDELKTRQRCQQKCRQALAKGMCPIIDRCNFDVAQRQTWYNLAMDEEHESMISVHVVNLHISVAECLRRCEARSDHETIAPQQARAVLSKLRKLFRVPTDQEADCIRSITTVRTATELEQVLQEHLQTKS